MSKPSRGAGLISGVRMSDGGDDMVLVVTVVMCRCTGLRQAASAEERRAAVEDG
jgi:hypothetical protein